MVTNNKQFVARIRVESKKPFYWMKQNIRLQLWLTQEKITIEENNISEMHCPKVGFLTQCHPRNDLIKVYEERLKKRLSCLNIPDFYCTVEYLAVRSICCKVIMIKCAEKDLPTLSLMFKKCKQTKLAKFEPWKQYEAMDQSKQIALIKLQIKMHVDYRSLLVSGFRDDDKVTMQ